MSNRKLQMEIDKALKKVAEGVEEFEAILEKLNATTNPAQREKFEAELKKEIKKLQRSRDQIKTWLGSSEIKDKRVLTENRRLIETQMERFKAIEKELKTKAFSKEGLGLPSKVDPEEVKKQNAVDWINETVDRLNQQIDGMEAQQEMLQVGGKRGKKNTNNDQLEILSMQVDRHRKHVRKLEIALRMLENGFLEPEQIDEIKENVDYYIDSYQDQEDDGLEIYDHLGLEEEEELFGTTIFDDHLIPHHDKEKKDDEPEPEPPSTPAVKTPRPAATPGRKKEATASKAPSALSSPKLNRADSTAPAPASVAAAVAVTASQPPQQQAPPPPPPPKLTAWNQKVKEQLPGKDKAHEASAPSSAPTSPPNAVIPPSISSNAVTATKAKGVVEPNRVDAIPSGKQTTTTKTKPSTRSSSPSRSASPPRDSKASVPSVSTAPVPAASTTVVPVEGSRKSPGDGVTSPPPKIGKSLTKLSSSTSLDAKTSDVAADLTTGGVQEDAFEGRVPASLADLFSVFQDAKLKALAGMPSLGHDIPTLLDSTMAFAPTAVDNERIKHYSPKYPCAIPHYYPQQPASVFDNPVLYERLDLDTLFFIFYYQQGTYQQYLAARELKRQSWRFHKRYLTWFQRHEEPKTITDDYEQGTYIYWDFEGQWCQRKKTDFCFEYRFLEDADIM